MRKALSFFAGATFLAATANQVQATRTRLRLKATEASYSKYTHTIVTDGLFPERSSYWSRLHAFFTDSDASSLSKSIEPSRLGSAHRLGKSLELENRNGKMWIGPIIMGGNTELNVVYDTGSDWLVIESSTCANCEGDKYDPSVSLG